MTCVSDANYEGRREDERENEGEREREGEAVYALFSLLFFYFLMSNID